MNVKININLVLGIIVVAILAYLPFHVNKNAGLDNTAIEAVVENYIKNNAKVIDDTMKAFYGPGNEQAGAPQEQKGPDRAKAINENKAELNNLEGAIIVANPEGKINMIEFVDYYCPFCKRNFATMEKISKENPNVRWVVKTITPMGGVDPAKATFAANMQGADKAKALHDAIFKFEGRADKATVLKLAEENGLDAKRLEADMESDAVKKQIDDAGALFRKLGGGGVPSIVIGETFIEGAYPEQEFLNAIEKAK